MRRLLRAGVIVAATAALAAGTAGPALAGGPRPAPKSECKAAARIVQAIDHGVPVLDDLSFVGMPQYVDRYNERLADRQPYGDPAPQAQVRAWLASEIANGCAGAVKPGPATRRA